MAYGSLFSFSGFRPHSAHLTQCLHYQAGEKYPKISPHATAMKRISILSFVHCFVVFANLFKKDIDPIYFLYCCVYSSIICHHLC